MRYAQINEDGYVVSDSWLSGKVESDNMIAITDDFDLTDKRYFGGKWVESPLESTEGGVMLTDEQKAFLELQANVEYLVCISEV